MPLPLTGITGTTIAMIAIVGYLLAIIFRMVEYLRGCTMTWHARVALAVACGAHLLTTVGGVHGVSLGQGLHLGMVTSVGALVLAGSCLALEWRRQETYLSILTLPLVIVMLASAGVSETRWHGPGFRGAWFAAHVLAAVGGEAFFVLAGMTSVSYLFVVRRLKRKNQLRAMQFFPSLSRLDQLTVNFTASGFGLFSLGLVAGAVWSVRSSGLVRLTAPKSLAALVVWVVFLVALIGRSRLGWAGPRLAWTVVLGTGLSMILALGIDNTLHWQP